VNIADVLQLVAKGRPAYCYALIYLGYTVCLYTNSALKGGPAGSIGTRFSNEISHFVPGPHELRDHRQIIRSKSEIKRNGFSLLFDFKIRSTLWKDLSVTETFLRVNEYP
jgi:hypothetical protein